MDWRRNWILLVTWTSGAAIAIYAAVLIIDPYDTVFFSPRLDRAPVVPNRRYSHPALARSQRFNSAIIGTSTVRLLAPSRFDKLTGERFVNLAMNAATAYEQSEIAKLFIWHHARPDTIVLGIDLPVWCHRGMVVRSYSNHPFPHWMYDRNRWNDLLHLFNAYAVRNAWHQLAHIVGLKSSPYGADGYTNFLPPRGQYDVERVRRLIYGNGERRAFLPVDKPIFVSPEERRTWRFGAHGYMRRILDSAPAATRKVLVFVPVHGRAQPRPGSRLEAMLEECKARVARMAYEYENAVVVDFMVASPITRNDRNYWDANHTTVQIAQRISEMIVKAAWQGRRDGVNYRILRRNGRRVDISAE